MGNRYNNLQEMLKDYFKNNKNDIFFNNEDNLFKSYSSDDILGEISNVAELLKKNNISSGKYVIMQMASKKNLYITLLALIYIKAIPIILPICTNENKLEQLFKVKQVNKGSSVICDEEGFNYINILKKDREINLITITKNDLDKECSIDKRKEVSRENLSLVNGSDTAVVLYSSGSTSNPKGVILTHEQILNGLENRCRELKTSSNDIFMSWMPLEHVIGLIDFVFLPIYNKAKFIYYEISLFLANPKKWFNILEQYKVTITAAPNFAFKYITDTINQEDSWDLSCVRIILNGGEPISRKVMENFLNAVQKFDITSERIVPIYGLTETTGYIALNMEGILSNKEVLKKEIETSLDDYDIEKFKFIKEDMICQGMCIEGSRVKIVDNNFKLQNDCVIGNILIKGNTVCSGYLSVDNENLFYDGWLNSGDIGFTSDNKLYVIGRKKDVVFSHGKNIYLRDIEYAATKLYDVRTAACSESIPKSAESYIYLFMEMCVEESKEKSKKKDIKKNILVETGVKIQDVIFEKKLCTTESGKIIKGALLKKYNKKCQMYNEVQFESYNSIMKFLQKIFNKNITLNTSIVEIMDDSIKMFQYIGLINKRYKCGIGMRHFIESNTIENLINIIVREKNIQVKREQSHKEESIKNATTLMQEAYILGREQNFYGGKNMSHFYMEIEHNMDINKAETCINEMIERNDMFRTIFDDKVPKVLDKNYIGWYEIEKIDITAAEENEYLEINRKNAQVNINDPSVWPLFNVKNICVEDSKNILIFDLDMLIIDGFSLRIILDEFCKLYDGKELPEAVNKMNEYLDYLNERTSSYKYIEDKKFWEDKVTAMPEAPKLPIKTNIADSPNLYAREEKVFTDKQWNKLEEFAKKSNVTVSVLLLYLYIKAVGRWSEETDFTINVTVYDRPISIEDINKTVGDFTSNILFDYKNSEYKSLSIRDQLKHMRDKMYSYFDYNTFSGVDVIREISKNQNNKVNGLMPVVYTSMLFENNIDFDYSKVSYSRTQTSQVSLDNQIYKLNDSYAIAWDYLEKVYPQGVIHDMFEYLCSLIDAIIKGNDIESVSIREEEIVKKYNDTDIDTEMSTLDSMIEEVFKNNRENTAIKYCGEIISYKKLNDITRYLIAEMQRMGIKKKDYVMVLTNKDIASVTVIIALARLGAAFIPVPADYPKERIEYIKENSLSNFILNAEEMYESLVSAEPAEIDGRCELDDSAYVIYTSGSTGNPKGVEISYEGVFNTIKDINNKFKIRKDDVILGLSSLNFDLSIYDIFGTLLAGASLIIVKDARDSEEITQIIKNNKVTLWNSVPAIMELFLEGLNYELKNDTLRYVLLSGDWVNLDLKERINEVFTNAEVISLGGATEGSIWSIYYPIHEVKSTWSSIPYGYPLANQKIYVLNKNMEICPAETAGEICIGGAGVAKRYTSDIQKTNASFVDTDKYGRIYKTGDFGKLSREGYVIFLGRKDSQVKLNGFRVELCEIEYIVKRIDEVRDVSVITDSNNKLISYYTANEEIQEDSMKEFLKKYLPNYMIPIRFVFMEKFPLTRNGKIDYKNMPVVYENVKDEKPIDDIEESVLNIWREFLKNQLAGLNDDFFYLGGDSITAQRISQKIKKQFNVKIPFAIVVNDGTARKISNFVRNKIKETEDKNSKIISNENLKVNSSDDDILNLNNRGMDFMENNKKDKEVNDKKEFELTGVQLAYLNGRNDSFELGKYNAHYYFEVEFSYNIEDIEKTLNEVIDKHDALRSVFFANGTQKILEDVQEYKIEIISTESELEFRDKNDEIRNELAHKNYDHSKWPMFTFKAVRNNNEKTILCVSIDLMICDGDSLRILLKDLASGIRGNKIERLNYNYVNYLEDLSAHLVNKEHDADKEFWNDKIDQFPDFPQLPIAQKIGLCKEYKVERIKEIINYDEWQKFKSISKKKKISPSSLLCAIYGLVLSRWSNQEDLLLNVTVFERVMFNKEVEKIIGDFTKLIPLEMHIENEDIWDIASNTQSTILEALEHKAYDGTEIVRELSRRRGTIGKALLPVVFTCILFDSPENWFEQLGKVQYAVSQTPQVFLDNQIVEMEGCLQITWDYVKELFAPHIMEEIFNEFISAIRQISDMSEVNLQPSALSQGVWEKYNKKPEEAELCTLKDLFELTADKKPDNIALVHEGKEYTYKFIDEKANQVSKYLCSMGICGANNRVGVLAKRKPETIISIIGIIKTGAAYVPIDPSFPKERQDFILNDSCCKILLTDSIYDSGELGQFDTSPFGIKALPDSQAYVIYTSGSTGVPKGAVITNKAVCNTIKDINERINLSEKDCLIGIASVCFDLSVYDIFGSFSNGAKLAMVKEPRDCKELVDIVKNNNVTIWNSVPVLYFMTLKYIKDNDIQEVFNVRQILLSGDWIPMELPKLSKEIFKNAGLMSLGGATEASIWSIYYCISQLDKEWTSIPYGMPLKNQTILVLDYNNRLCPPGVKGEICIGGVGVAQGYNNNEKKTQEAFIDHSEFGRIYKTGDLGVLHSEGYIELIGRKDNQVKIRGYRIELDEIEFVLNKIPNVKAAIVRTVDGTNNTKQLVAYYVSVDNKELNISETKEYICRSLPDYMIPQYFVKLHSLPLSKNGKINRKKLPQPVIQSDDNDEKSDEPITENQKFLVEIWEKIFNLKHIGVRDDFYSLGGDSIILMQMLDEFNSKSDMDISIEDILNNETIEKIAAFIESCK